MKSYFQLKEDLYFLAEANKNNAHLTHYEDAVFYRGSRGVKKALESAIQLVKGSTNLNLSFKVDGSPAVFFGLDPQDKQFFVAKKSIFNNDPKVYKSHEAIDSDVDGDLAHKLHYAFNYLKKLNPQCIMQGDMLYTKNTVKEKAINGKGYLTFHPNTLIYGVPRDSKSADNILDSKMGIVIHTKWKGRDFKSLTPIYHVDKDDFRNVKDVWAKRPYMDIRNIKFTSEDISEIKSIAKESIQYLKKCSRFLNHIASQPNLAYAFEAYHNNLVRNGHITQDSYKYITDLKTYFSEKKPKYVSALTDDNSLLAMFELHQRLTKIKNKINTVLNDQEPVLKAFISKQDGTIIDSDIEGYVLSSADLEPLKFVNRLEFSKHNFDDENIQKGWTK